MATQQIHFRAGDLEPLLIERARKDETLASVARRDLGRYHMLMIDELDRMPEMSKAEWETIVDVVSSTTWAGDSYLFLWARVDDEGEHDLAGRLRKLAPGTLMALVDGAEVAAIKREKEKRADGSP